MDTNPSIEKYIHRFLEAYAAQETARDVSTGSKRPLYLALDFDGVLHHAFCGPRSDHCQKLGAGEINAIQFLAALLLKVQEYGWEVGMPFDRTHALADVLDASPFDVRIVIATSWRLEIALDDLVSLMPARLARRVVRILDLDCEFDGNGYSLPGAGGQLMARWMARHAPQSPWVALDDTPEHWVDHSDRLVETHMAGVDQSALAALRTVMENLARARIA